MANRNFNKKLAIALGALIGGTGALGSMNVSTSAEGENDIKSTSQTLSGLVIDGNAEIDERYVFEKNVNWTNLINFQKALSKKINENIQNGYLMTENMRKNTHKLLRKMMAIALKDLNGISNFIENLLLDDSKVIDEAQLATLIETRESFQETTKQLVSNLKDKYALKD